MFTCLTGPSSKPEEQTTSEQLLKIFRASIPHMPKTAAKFGQELQLALQPMILRPSTAAGVQVCGPTRICWCPHSTNPHCRDCKKPSHACVLPCNTSLTVSIASSDSCARAMVGWLQLSGDLIAERVHTSSAAASDQKTYDSSSYRRRAAGAFYPAIHHLTAL